MSLPPTASRAAAATVTASGSRVLAALVILLFFLWGGATSLNDVLIPKLKGLYALTYAEAMLTQFAFFMAYFIVSLPAGALVARIGYARGLVTGLLVTALGALGFWPAAASGAYAGFLVALFVLASGITLLQVASNPFITASGDERTASARLTFAQGFNSIGTTIWPYIGSGLILAGAAHPIEPATLPPAAAAAYRVHEGAIVAHVYAGIALVLAAMAAVFWRYRRLAPQERPEAIGLRDSLALLADRRVAFGVAALFAYVGAEVAIGSIMVNYLGQADVLGLDPHRAGQRLSLYWGGAMLGRFAGAALLRRFEPGRLLATFAGVAAALVLVSILGRGGLAAAALLATGLFNSILFPTIFSLAVEGQGDRAPAASGLLCMAIVGGAIVPLAVGHVADALTIRTALIVPVLCYATVAAFGLLNPSRTPAPMPN